MTRLRTKISAALGMALALSMLVAAPADARRGGSFGSRGSRTYSAPAPTATAPSGAVPVQRSMTAPGATPGGAFAPRPGQPGYSGYRPGYGYGYGSPFGRSPMGGFFGGLVAGGLIGGLFGHGWGGGWGGGGWGGGGGGLLTILIQLVIFGVIASFLMRMFRRRSAYSAYEEPAYGGGPQPYGGPAPGFGGGGGFSGGPAAAPYVPTTGPSWEIHIDPQDQAMFETLLKEIQDAFGREDYAALRERCTPEIVSYLSEELSENATHGKRNEVTGTRLLQADVGEAWREGDVEYATAAMKYESIDLMRDRTTGAVLSGDPNRPSQTTELWTFARHVGGAWKLSAIQEAN